MKKNILISMGLVCALYGFTFLKGNTWTVDAKNIKISFDVPADPHQLSFTTLDASINFDPLSPAASEIIARIDVKSLVTEDPGLTKHLLSPDFLDAEKFPQIKFISTRIEKKGQGFIAYGGLALKDSVHAVSIPFTFTQNDEEASFKGSFSIFSGDYGVMKKSKSGSVKVIISLEI